MKVNQVRMDTTPIPALLKRPPTIDRPARQALLERVLKGMPVWNERVHHLVGEPDGCQ